MAGSSGKQLYGPSEMLAARSTADYSGATVGINRFVKFAGTSSSVDGVPNVTRNDTAGGECLGILTDKPKTSETASIQTGGLAKVEAGSALATIGAYVTSDSQGRAVAAATGNRVLGEVFSVAGGAGEIITIRQYPVHFTAP
jgi:hypothetical protein